MSSNLSRRLLRVEPLEDRNLLAAFINAGTLCVIGSGRNDFIQISPSGTDLMVWVNQQVSRFAASNVTALFVHGLAGMDSINVDETLTIGAVIHGGQGHDRIGSGGGNDVLFGEQGDDQISGGGGNDWITAGVGRDTARGGDGDDTLHGDGGNDVLQGDVGLDQLFGDVGHDQLYGGEDDDALFGGLGNDYLLGGLANDLLNGEWGNDLLSGEEGDNWLIGGEGHDTLWGGPNNDILKGNAGNDSLDGGAGDNLLDGDTGQNQLSNGLAVDLDLQLAASLTSASTATATARYEQVIENGVVQTELKIVVVGATPATPLDITIDGQLVVGTTILTDVNGDGTLTFSTDPQNDEVLLPNGLSLTLHSGSAIELGLAAYLTGVFAPVFPA